MLSDASILGAVDESQSELAWLTVLRWPRHVTRRSLRLRRKQAIIMWWVNVIWRAPCVDQFSRYSWSDCSARSQPVHSQTASRNRFSNKMVVHCRPVIRAPRRTCEHVGMTCAVRRPWASNHRGCRRSASRPTASCSGQSISSIRSGLRATPIVGHLSAVWASEATTSAVGTSRLLINQQAPSYGWPSGSYCFTRSLAADSSSSAVHSHAAPTHEAHAAANGQLCHRTFPISLCCRWRFLKNEAAEGGPSDYVSSHLYITNAST